MLLGDFWKEKNNSFWVIQLLFIPNSLVKGISMCHSSRELCISPLLWKGLETAEPVRVPQWSVLAWGCTLSQSRSLSGELQVLVGMTGEQPGGSYPIPSPGASFLLSCPEEWKGDGKEWQFLSQKIVMSLDRQGNSLNIVGFYRSACLCNMFVSLGTQVRLQHKGSGI